MLSVGMLVWGCAWGALAESPGGAISSPAEAGKGCLPREQFGTRQGWFAAAEVCTDLSEGWSCNLSHP